MSRILFTLEADVYELTHSVKQHFIEKTSSDDTVEVWFEGQRLYHTYTLEDGTIETDWVDAIDSFQNVPKQAQELLQDVGVEPIITATDGIYPTSSTGLIDPRSNT